MSPKTAEAKQEVAVVKDEVPAYVKDAKVGVIVQEERSLTSIPRIVVLQKLSNAVSEGKGKPGQFYNTLTEDCFDNVEFCPLFVKQAWMKFSDDRKMEWYTEERPWPKFVKTEKEASGLEALVVLGYAPKISEEYPVQITFYKGHFWNGGKQLYRLIRYKRGGGAGFIFRLITTEETYPKGKAFVMRTQEVGYLDIEGFQKYKSMQDAIASFAAKKEHVEAGGEAPDWA
jgi:hypothetical protein